MVRSFQLGEDYIPADFYQIFAVADQFQAFSACDLILIILTVDIMHALDRITLS